MKKLDLEKFIKKLEKAEDKKIALKEIEVETYINFALKRAMMQTISIFAKYEDPTSGLQVCDETLLELWYTLLLTLDLTNIDIKNLFSEEEINGEKVTVPNMEVALNSYDLLMKSKVFCYIEGLITNNDIYQLTSLKIQREIEANNSLSATVNRLLIKLIDKIPSEENMKKIFNEAPKIIESIKNTENYDLVKDLYEKFK